MYKRLEKILVGFDQIASALLGVESWETSSGGVTRSKSFWIGWGQKFVILDPDGSISSLGNSWQVEHVFDDHGNFLERKRYVKILRPGQKVIYGHHNAYALWELQHPNVSFG